MPTHGRVGAKPDPRWRLGDPDHAVLDQITSEMQAGTWAEWVTPGYAARVWHDLAVTVAHGTDIYEEYVDDLYCRLALEEILDACPEDLGARIRATVEIDDEEFRAGTAPGEDGMIDPALPIDRDKEWWWYRRPLCWPERTAGG
jgi:hypothetical protein